MLADGQTDVLARAEFHASRVAHDRTCGPGSRTLARLKSVRSPRRYLISRLPGNWTYFGPPPVLRHLASVLVQTPRSAAASSSVRRSSGNVTADIAQPHG